jgi:1-acyl-sn-glycerol-3-phosphate acyltransferase
VPIPAATLLHARPSAEAALRRESLPVTFEGSAFARSLLRLFGWRVRFNGLPGRQGVIIVYPHTSNWDFVVGLIAKWAIGIPVSYWMKASAFRVPLFGRWARWTGGIPLDRSSPAGIVEAMTEGLIAARREDRLMWLALTPEGTRSHRPHWRSGFHRLVVDAGVPLGIAWLDYGRREVVVEQFIELSGDRDRDIATIAGCYEGVRGCRHEKAAPIRFAP